MLKYLTLAMLYFGCGHTYAQGLFEDAVITSQDAGLAVETRYELNGFVRGLYFGGKVPNEDDAETKSVYGEMSLEIAAQKGSAGRGYTEFRIRKGSEFNETTLEYSLREAYVDTYLGGWYVRFGQQIVVWGRADGINPTNNITPMNMVIRSPEEDDRREGNFLVKTNYVFRPCRLEMIWIPTYRASVLPLEHVELPEGIVLAENDSPNADISHGAFAMKLNIEKASFDGSVSYFNGYNPLPGLCAEVTDQNIAIVPTAYRMQIIGADFSTSCGPYGLRGELAYRYPAEDHLMVKHVPNPDLQYVFGIDRSHGDFSLIVQYLGRYVWDYSHLEEPVSAEGCLGHELEIYNRMFFSQLEEMTHSISFRPSWSLFHETLDAEILGMYNLATEETYLKPKVSYDLVDDVTVTAGGELYAGPDDTLYGLLDTRMSAVFVECKTSF